jgi:pimeloyl-ACP methyl ester carboxylesterase
MGLGIHEFGDPTGSPVIAFHGVPACGAGFDWTGAPARELGLRIVAPDRPGVSRSPRAARDWSIADHADGVVELADSLGFDRFAALGYSGGGPYSVAVASRHPDRVSALAVCAGMGEVGTWATAEDFAATDRRMLDLCTKHPRIAQLMLGAMGVGARLSPGTAMKSFDKELAEADRAVIPTLGPPRQAMAMFIGAFEHGARGVVDDYRAINHPWGVDLARVSAPTRIHQGTADTLVPVGHAEELANRIRGSELVLWHGEGHLGTITHIAEILQWISGVDGS